MSLEGQVAVITGATRGIGKDIARSLAKRGAHLVLCGRSTNDNPNRAGLPGTLEGIEAELRAAGTEVIVVAADLARAEDLQKVVDATMSRFGRCDLLVNNAAVSFLGPFLEVPVRRWQPVIAVNLMATVTLCHAFLPGMLERGSGRIINMSSGAADTKVKQEVTQLPYSASKAAIEAVTFSLAHQFAPHVAVNCTRPQVLTEAVTYSAPQLLGRPDWAQPDDYGEAMAWLAQQPLDFTCHCLDNEALMKLGALPRR
ncbi:MAG: SDR family NAD(P)-dependent oxidoreductase [Gammaproteobacteria bacterium]